MKNNSPSTSRAWLIIAMILVLVLICARSTPTRGHVPLDCHDPWVLMSPGLATAKEARVNLDQHGAWVIQASNWLVIWDQDGAVAAHGLQAWEAEVHLASSQDPDVCGFIQVIMGDPLVIPDWYDKIDSILL